MTERPVDRPIDAWTESEREVWKAWSAVGQDLSQDAGSGCEHVLNALEASAQQMARLHARMFRDACELIGANPFVPEPARGWLSHATQRASTLADVQQQLIAAWFGMARQTAAIASSATPCTAAHFPSGSRRRVSQHYT